MELITLAGPTAPWISAVFGIGTAIAADRAFSRASQGEAPDLWPGSESHLVFSVSQDSEDMCARACARTHAAALQSVATFFGTGTAIEAAAASQVGVVAVILVTLGIIIALVPSLIRWAKAAREIATTKASFLRMSWSHDRKLIASQDWVAEDAFFAQEHPREASLLKRDKNRRAY